MLRDDTIAALSTAPGEGAIAVVRISGPATRSVLEAVFDGRSPSLDPRRMAFGAFVGSAGIVDRGLAVFFPSPSSYTGEDLAELHCHGGIHVSASVLEIVLEAGTRLAEPGEFTTRAFLNGKLDLTQAEAVMDVIRARTQLALRAAREQLEGRLGSEADKLREEILGIVAHVEAWIDFPEEDVHPASGAELVARIRGCHSQMEALLATARTGRILREGYRVVLWGAPNAGKSSLLNRLLGYDRAIVDAAPGTTRDTIEEPVSLGGIPCRITDTAGLRDADGTVERLGIERARRAIADADLAIHVVDSSTWRGPLPEDPLVAWNKCDLPPARPTPLPPNVVAVSCLTGEGMDDLVASILRQAGMADAPPSLAAINARHQACLVRASRALQEALSELESGRSAELAAPCLREALDAVGELAGAANTEEILGTIFSNFCIGK